MSYRAPVADIAFALKHGAGMNDALSQGLGSTIKRRGARYRLRSASEVQPQAFL